MKHLFLLNIVLLLAIVLNPAYTLAASSNSQTEDITGTSLSSYKNKFTRPTGSGGGTVVTPPTDAEGEEDVVVIPPTESEENTATIPEPTGVYSLIGARMKVSSATTDNPNVSGIVLRDKWINIEPQQGVYDWSYLDETIASLASVDKKLMLGVISGSLIGSPSWLYDLGVKKFSFISDGVTQSIPVFWDPIFLENKKNLIRELGARYSANKQIVSIHAHCMNSNTDDWFVPATTTDINNLLALGYTTEKAIDACKQIIDTTMEAFPNQTVRMAIGRINMAMDTVLKDSDYVAKELIAYANTTYPGRFYAQRHNLNAVVPDPFDPTSKLDGWQVMFDNQPMTAAQMVWMASDVKTCRMNGNKTPCNSVTMLNNAVTLATHYGMKYLEIYQADIQNSELLGVIEDAAILLGN